jgi:hypothetical protein
VIDVPGVLDAALTASAAAIPGTSAIVALIIALEANKPSRTLLRDLIDERPLAEGLVGSVELVVSCAAQI